MENNSFYELVMLDSGVENDEILNPDNRLNFEPDPFVSLRSGQFHTPRAIRQVSVMSMRLNVAAFIILSSMATRPLRCRTGVGHFPRRHVLCIRAA
jgi:hypothetical protein